MNNPRPTIRSMQALVQELSDELLTNADGLPDDFLRAMIGMNLEEKLKTQNVGEIVNDLLGEFSDKNLPETAFRVAFLYLSMRQAKIGL